MKDEYLMDVTKYLALPAEERLQEREPQEDAARGGMEGFRIDYFPHYFSSSQEASKNIVEDTSSKSRNIREIGAGEALIEFQLEVNTN